MIRNAHTFRGEYIDTCAQIEQWAIEVMQTPRAQATGKVGKRLPYMFGQKLKLVAELAQDDTIFSRPSRVRELLNRLAPYATLRSALAHATCTYTGTGKALTIIFEMPGALPLPVTEGRFWLTPQDTSAVISQLKAIRKELADQRVKPASPA